MKHSYLKNVTTLTYSIENCIGCGKCVDVCPHSVFDMDNGKALIVDSNSCMECGACALNCPANALKVDAGVGCALAFIIGWLTGKEPTCGCSESDCC